MRIFGEEIFAKATRPKDTAVVASNGVGDGDAVVMKGGVNARDGWC